MQLVSMLHMPASLLAAPSAAFRSRATQLPAELAGVARCGLTCAYEQGTKSLDLSIKELRAPTFQHVYSALNSSLASNGALRGTTF